MVDVNKDQVTASRHAFRDNHVATYYRTGGADGHLVDLRGGGGYQITPTILVETFGRKSGVRRIIPLVYGLIDGHAVIVAAKAGHDEHPDWYLNIVARPGISFQIGGQAFRGEWREPAGEERARIWDFMTRIAPQYIGYQEGTQRKIPLVMLKPVEPVTPFTSEQPTEQ